MSLPQGVDSKNTRIVVRTRSEKTGRGHAFQQRDGKSEIYITRTFNVGFPDSALHVCVPSLTLKAIAGLYTIPKRRLA